MQKQFDVTSITRETYDQIAKGYSLKIKKLTSETWVGRFEMSLIDKFISLINAVNPGTARVVDIGCGYGKDTSYLSTREQIIATGIDYSSGMLSEARKMYPSIDFIQADMRLMVFSGACFDGVWANGCIYHIMKKDLNGMLSEVKRVLKPGGIFSFNIKLGEAERLEQNPRSFGGKPRFYAYYEVGEMRGLLEESGLEVMEIEPYPETIFNDRIAHAWTRK